jgi:hypothetical protein
MSPLLAFHVFLKEYGIAYTFIGLRNTLHLSSSLEKVLHILLQDK